MTLILDLGPELEERLRDQAERRGLAAPDLARSILARGLAQGPTAPSRDEIHDVLRAAGLVRGPRPRGVPIEEFRRYQPVALPGKPLSQQIIEDRR